MRAKDVFHVELMKLNVKEKLAKTDKNQVLHINNNNGEIRTSNVRTTLKKGTPITKFPVGTIGRQVFSRGEFVKTPGAPRLPRSTASSNLMHVLGLN